MSSRLGVAALVMCGVFALASSALAHVGISSGPGYANQNQVLTFGVGHGCEGADTAKIEVAIPKEVASVRGVPSTFGPAEVITNDAGIVTAVSWTKAAAVRELDDQYYQLGIRIRVPDAPFTTLLFSVKQTCKKPDGTETVVNWDAPPSEAESLEEGSGRGAAAVLNILPVRSSGWNKYTVAKKIEDLSIFDDAQIVWSGDAAYSKNAVTAEQIKSEDGVSELTAIEADAEIWVKY